MTEMQPCLMLSMSRVGAYISVLVGSFCIRLQIVFFSINDLIMEAYGSILTGIEAETFNIYHIGTSEHSPQELDKVGCRPLRPVITHSLWRLKKVKDLVGVGDFTAGRTNMVEFDLT